MTNKLVFENLKFRPVRTGLSVVAVALEVTMILTIVGLSRGTLADTQQRARGVGADIFIRPRGSSVISLSSASIDERLVDWIEKQPHVTLAVGNMVQPLAGLATVNGVDFAKFKKLSGGFRFIEGGPPKGSNELVVDRYFARQDGLKVGSTMNILNRPWRVSGIFEEGKLARIVMPIRVLQDLTGNIGKISQIYVKVDKPADVAPVINLLKSNLPGYPIYSMEELLSLISASNVPMLKAFTGVVIGISVIVGFLVVFLSMYTSVLERTREIGILKSLGASPGFVLGVLLWETTLIALFGAVLGILFSFGSRWLIGTVASAILSQYIVPDWWPIARHRPCGRDHWCRISGVARGSPGSYRGFVL